MNLSLAYSASLGEPIASSSGLPPPHTLETPARAGDMSLSAALLALVGEPGGVPHRDYERHLSAAVRSRHAAARRSEDIKAKAAKFNAFHNAKVEEKRAADAASRAADTSVNAPLVPDTNFAVAFLAAIDPPGRHDLLAIDSYLPAKHPAKIEAATFFPTDQEKMRAWIDARQGKKNLYVSVNRAKADAPLNARLSKSDVSIIRAVVADIDASKVLHGDPSGENFYRERDRLLQVVAKSLSNDKQCPPTFVVDSGGGLQAWWVLAPSLPATPDNIELVEGIGRTIQRRYNGDSVFDVARIMRLPGTINVLSPDKREQGREPAVAKVLDENCAGAMYLIEALKSWAPPTAEAAKREDNKAGWDKIDMAAVEEVVTYEDLPAGLRDKFERYYKDRPFVGALWRGEEVPGDGTPSVRVYALAGQLRMAGTFTITEFAQLVWVWEFRSERHADEFERYVSRAWNRNTAPLGGEDFNPLPERQHAPAPNGRSNAAPEGWSEPADLWSDESGPPDLPAGIVPAVIEGVARDQALRLGVEPGASAAALITALGALVPAGNQMQLRQHDTQWLVKPILWTCLVGEPGSNKSATLKYATAPIHQIEKQWAKEYASERRTYDLRHPRADAKKRVASHSDRADAEKFVKADDSALLDSEWVNNSEAPPKLRRKLVDDATTEKLAELLSQNPSGLLLLADELAGLFGGMDAYRQKGGKDRAFWLKAKDGAPIIVDRKGNDTLRAENGAISVLGGIQPAKIKALSDSLSDDGMLQRFLPVIIKPMGEGEDVEPDKALDDALQQVAMCLVECEAAGTYLFSPEADAEYRQLETFKRAEIVKPTVPAPLRQWLEKVPNVFGCLALVFHFIEHYASAENALVSAEPPARVSVATAGRARRFLVEFAYPHAAAFHTQVLGASAIEEQAQWVAGLILSRGMPVVTERDVYRSCPAFKSKDRRDGIIDAMRVLQLEGWVQPSRWQGNKPNAWAVNPGVHTGFVGRAEMERERRKAVQGSIHREASERRAERSARNGGE